MTTPSPAAACGPMRILSTANEQERALRATADAHERRFSALTERSPIPTLLSEQGMRLAHVNDAFCAWSAAGRAAARHGWINTIHEDDLDGVIEQVAAALDGDEVETQARLVRRTAPSGRRHPVRPPVHPGRRGRLRRHDRGHHRPAGVRDQARPPGQPRSPDRTAQPHPAGPVRRRQVPSRQRRPGLPLPRPRQLQGRQRLPRHTAGDELLIEVADRLR